ncbi:SusD/RagB family nutrient-binding outer membrane lipoprotein [Pedobacter aquatilis]|uniref:SusD/RagB family nutrient-binding outer membrane lipoprotein n=1 Tax=Pedobacter aquatilis TaxID=351343 RepID=UPI002931EB38|nr:SusD/RagB family nutrient-binding outer membrane lipoprotein [Pedobacter aquatilis]
MKNKIIYAVLAVIISGSSACKKVLDINDNPNASTTVTKDMLLAGTLLSTTRLENGAVNEIGSFYAGYWGKAYDASGSATGAAATALDLIGSYNIIDNFATDIWEKSYTNIYNYTLLQNQTQNEAPFYAGVAKIMKGLHFLRLVDHYNNVPFSEASNPSITQPKYDSAESVYAGALDLITAGIADIKRAGTTTVPSTSDIFFKGNAQSWIKFANTIKLRALLQQSQLSSRSTYIATELAKITTEGSGYLTADVLANPSFTTQSDNQQNPFYTTYYRTAQGTIPTMFNAIRPTRFLLSGYDLVNDPRKALVYAEATNGGGYKGVLLGQNIADATQNATATSAFRGPGAGVIKTATSGALIISLSESLFLQAEAVQRGWISGNAKSLYENAIQASFNYISVPATSFTAYNAQAAVAFDDASATDKIVRIISQKWLALNSISGASAWNDFRRLGLPQGVPLAVAKTSYPKRLRYPTSEVSTNSAQVKAQGNIDGLVNKVFWNQ